MRRSLPTFLCVVMSTGLLACDPEPVSEPLSDDQLALFNFRSGETPAIPGYPGDGDITVRRGDSNGGGGDIDLFDVFTGVVSRSSDGATLLAISDTSLTTPGGTTLCFFTEDNGFTVLRDVDNTPLYASIGPWVFEGLPDLTGLSDDEQFAVLQAALLASFEDEEVVDGFPATGDAVASSTAELELATARRKLLVKAMLDGTCGGEQLGDAGL